MRKRLLIFICLYFTLNGYSQESKGYFNSRFYVSFDALVNSPLIYNLRTNNEYYAKYDKKLNIKSDKLNYGFRANIAVLLKRNLAFGIEGGIDYGNVYLNKSMTYQDTFSSNGYTSYNIYDINVILEKLDIQTFSFMPKIEFSIKNSLLPLGLSHQFGIGVNYSKLIERNYASNSYYDQSSYDYNGNYYNSQIPVTDLSAKLFDYKNQLSTKTYTILYALSMKTALTKNILLNYGFRYTLNIHGFNLFSDKNNGYYVSQATLSEQVYKQRFNNLINFNLGLTYAF